MNQADVSYAFLLVQPAILNKKIFKDQESMNLNTVLFHRWEVEVFAESILNPSDSFSAVDNFKCSGLLGRIFQFSEHILMTRFVDNVSEFKNGLHDIVFSNS